MLNNLEKTDKIFVGWKEWASLPSLKVPFIKVKIDTGAKTSALHAYDLETFYQNGKRYAKFIIHPLQRDCIISIPVVAEIIDVRQVKSSNGHKEDRVVTRVPIKIGDKIWDIDVTLTNRDIMHHRMLLGREAMRSFVIDPGRTYCQGKHSAKGVQLIYSESAKS